MFHVVDDAKLIGKIVVTILESHGYRAMSFSCPQDYINFVKEPSFKSPIAVFTDVNMPKMNGYEMMSSVSKLKPGLKFVVMTSEPDTQSKYITKACMHLVKPFAPNVIIELVNSLIQCHVHSPSNHHGCASVGNREAFSIGDWSCPHRCKRSALSK
ncbi:MAG: response regulator [Mariprofundaceae bacterium]